jgi:hypothetical protein
MARINDGRPGSGVPLPEHAMLGRDPSCWIIVDHARVSRTHARVWWSGTSWWVRDLGSRNGSWLGSERLEPGKDVRFRAGAPLCLGDPTSTPWTLVDEDPPRPLARSRSGELVCGTADLLVFGEGPELSVWKEPHGGWSIDDGGELREVVDGEEIDGWRLSLPMKLGATAPAVPVPRLDEVSILLKASRDMEHCRCELRGTFGTLDLGEKQHWFVLWVLADPAEGDGEGWVDLDRLARRTGIERRSLDTYISRARKDLAEAGIEGAFGVVASRPNQRRLGVDRRRVTREG